MALTKAGKKAQKDAKKKKKEALVAHQQSPTAPDGPKKLKIRLPPPRQDVWVEHSPEHSPSLEVSLEITPPPAASPNTTRHALNEYLQSRSRTPHEEDADEDEDEDEEDQLESDDVDNSSLSSSDDEPVIIKQPTKPVVPPKKASAKVGKAKATSKKPDTAVLSLKFSVPVDGANTSFTIPSTLTYPELVTALADAMAVAPKNVRVGYRFSLQPRSDPYNHLANAGDWMDLVAAARHTLETSKSKKEFVVELKDLQAADKKGKAAEKGKKDKKKRKRGDTDDESDASTGDERAKKKPLNGPQWVAKLQADNTCTEHGGEGCIKYTTGHVKLSKQDLSGWAIFMQNGYPSTTTPPPTLKMSAELNKKKVATTPAASAAPIAGMAGMPPFGIPFPYQYPPQWASQAYHTPTPHPTARYGDFPSSDPVEEAEDVTLFPRLEMYLSELDNGVRGQDGHDFSQFLPAFEQEKYVRIADLEGMTVTDLKDLIPDIALGTASKLLGYVTLDVSVIRKREKKRARKQVNRFA
ncbi:hypothetical protein C8R46DRAFT_1025722 [Mycena filopes]|nr:hypothetical protein C8R46DRAFT_1025722 [Mycena filopes]